MMESESQPSSTGLRPEREYGAAASAAAHAPFIRIIGYVFAAHAIGVMCCVAIHQQFANIDGVQDIMLTSGLIFAIALIPTTLAYFMFRNVIAAAQEAASMVPEGEEASNPVADEMNADAMRRAKNGFKLLSFSGVCFVASTLIGISGLLSL